MVRRIVDGRSELLRFPLNPPMGAAHSIDVIVTTLTAQDGQSGMGFSYVVLGRDNLPVLLARSQLERFVIGQELTHPLELWRRIAASFNRGRSLRTGHGPHVVALASIDVAAWDLYAKSLGQPIGVAMGGTPRRVPVYRGEGFVRGQDPDEAAAVAHEHLRAGARGVKLRANGTPHDAKVLRAVAERVGGTIDIMVDMNQRGTLSSAKRLLRYAAEYGVRFVEEPLPVAQKAGYATLARNAPAPIATGENFCGSVEAAPFLINRWCSFIQPDLAGMGGLSDCLRTAQLAEHCNVEIAPHFLPGLFIQLAAAAPHLAWLEDHPTFEALFVATPHMEPDGYMSLPAAHGHGLVLSEDARAAFRVA